MKNCNPISTLVEIGMKHVKDPKGRKIDNNLYKQIVGSLMYLTTTILDIMHAISLISRFIECPKEMHLLAAKWIFRYLQGMTDYELLYKSGEWAYLFSFTNSDYAGDLDDRKSTFGYVFMMGSGAISWSSRKQSIVTFQL